MFTGHYGAAFAAKAVRPNLSLGALFVAVQLSDILWATLVLTGVEKVRITPGFTASNPLDLYFMSYSHSLLAAVSLALLAAVVWKLFIGSSSWVSSCLIGLAVLSHWFLDFPVHIKDLPLYGDRYKAGFGLWNHPVASLILEIGVVLVAACWMERSRSASTAARWRTVLLSCLILPGIQMYSFFGPIPATPQLMAMTTLPIYLCLAVLAWVLERNNWHQEGSLPSLRSREAMRLQNARVAQTNWREPY